MRLVLVIFSFLIFSTFAEAQHHDAGLATSGAVDLGKIDGQRIGQRIDFALGRRGARDRQCAGNPVHRTVWMFPLLAISIGHSDELMRD